MFAMVLLTRKVPFAYDLARTLALLLCELNRRIAGTRRSDLMAAQVDDERLVGDFEREARRIVAFCDIPWDPACLSFHEVRRPVRTASNLQVRQPLYHSSVGRAQAFLTYLGPLIEAMKADVE